MKVVCLCACTDIFKLGCFDYCISEKPIITILLQLIMYSLLSDFYDKMAWCQRATGVSKSNLHWPLVQYKKTPSLFTSSPPLNLAED